MNLLVDKWIPVTENGVFKQIALKELLCGQCDDGVEITLPRDDMAFAALQLIICICQILFLLPESELKQKAEKPVSENEYEKAIKPYIEWFDLFHDKYPFMQTMTKDEILAKSKPKSGKKKKEADDDDEGTTPIQKIFPGLPAGDGSHMFFNSSKEIESICPSCAAIALFNQASNAPSFGGGFKNGLRGSAAITAFINKNSLLSKIFANVLPKDFKGLPSGNDNNPTWVELLKKDANIAAPDIGLLRGLFWQPIKIKILSQDNKNGTCMSCGIESKQLVSDYISQKFKFDVKGYWNHPHSAKMLNIKKNEERSVSFNNMNPAWTYIPGILYKKEVNGILKQPPATIAYFLESNQGPSISLLIGGYKNNKAKIENRRHDITPISSNWQKDFSHLSIVLEKVDKFLESLKRACYIKSGGIVINLQKQAAEYFYQYTEPCIYNIIKNINWNDKDKEEAGLFQEIEKIVKKIFRDITVPYRHKPEYLVEILKKERSLSRNLVKEMSVNE